METEEAIRELTKGIFQYGLIATPMDKAVGVAVEALLEKSERDKADGCEGCAFYDKEEWDMPCSRCQRNCKDYWRKKENKDVSID